VKSLQSFALSKTDVGVVTISQGDRPALIQDEQLTGIPALKTHLDELAALLHRETLETDPKFPDLLKRLGI
jgi:hypothetical protein